MPNIAIFASGSGTNAENLIRFFQNKSHNIVSVYCNNPNAGVINRVQNYTIPIVIFNKTDFYETDSIINDLLQKQTDVIILAGFLLLLPVNLVRLYDKKIINIHPALLPKYGGKGMYGMNVHRAVVQNKEVQTGITIHLVDEIYDNGKILFQTECSVLPDDTPEMVAHKVQELEYEHFPRIVEEYIQTI